MIMINYFFMVISINPKKVMEPPIQILNPMDSPNIKNAKMVAIIGSPRGNGLELLGQYLKI